MTNYVIINGVNSNTINGLGINELPPITKPLQRSLIEEIDGRDGDIITKLGYGAYDKTMTIGLFHTYDIDEVIAFFNGEGTITFSNEPDKVYYFTILDQIDYEKLINFKTATITLHCQPFKYPIEEAPIEIAYQYVEGTGETLTLENTAEAQMEIDLKGNTQQDSTTGKNLLPISPFNNGYSLFTLTGDVVTQNNTTSASWAWGWARTFFRTMLPAGTYTLTMYAKTKSTGSSAEFRVYDSNDTQLAASGTQQTGETSYISFTLNSETQIGVVAKMYDGAWRFQLETGSSSSAYEPYTNGASPNPDYPQLIHTCSGDNTIKVEGKNLFAIKNYSKTGWNITIDNPLKGLSTGKYTISCVNKYITANKGMAIVFSNGSGDNVGYFVGYDFGNIIMNKTTNLTQDMLNANYLVIMPENSLCTQEVLENMKIQLEKGSTATTYEPYTSQSHLISLGDIELNKIGTYQDKIYKDNGIWYLHKEIGKVVLDGSEDSWANDGGGAPFKITLQDASVYVDMNMPPLCYADKFKGVNYNDNWNNYNSLVTTTSSSNTNKAKILKFRYTDISSLANFKTWLSTHNTIVYYVLATPTNTEITDTTLLEQLENIANARSYDTSTHITQNANDKPFILNATAMQKGSDTGVVDNDGNIYSKPTLDIEGTGTVGIYLNNNQMFSIDMSSSSECVIDVTNLEAYDPSTNELMNRQVTGDYSNFTLPVGENEVKVSGNVTKATISNYVRWL